MREGRNYFSMTRWNLQPTFLSVSWGVDKNSTLIHFSRGTQSLLLQHRIMTFMCPTTPSSSLYHIVPQTPTSMNVIRPPTPVSTSTKSVSQTPTWTPVSSHDDTNTVWPIYTPTGSIVLVLLQWSHRTLSTEEEFKMNLYGTVTKKKRMKKRKTSGFLLRGYTRS